MNQCKRILIVDDDPNIREALKEYLEFEGYEVRVAGNGQEALALLKINEKPCLILLDLMMPVMNGWEFARAAALDAGISQIPIVVTSAFIDKVEDIKARGLLSKPLDMEQLMGLANECCPAI
ncbi:response regulator [Peredibacter starrii]|uniref:Response regulator n=1 Tax=Peredibacter starrii TaxID=28202 RepID=A0AAX4HKJ4_9BACT|nr:response regulator [Peredibacter starrii]WPU63764.1 response regulator [Peredibacter starrii]